MPEEDQGHRESRVYICSEAKANAVYSQLTTVSAGVGLHNRIRVRQVFGSRFEEGNLQTLVVNGILMVL